MDTLAEGLKYYPYYKEAYGAVLGGMVGYFDQEAGPEEAASETAGPEQASTEETGSGTLGHKIRAQGLFPPSPETSHTATMTTSAFPAPTATSAAIWAMT